MEWKYVSWIGVSVLTSFQQLWLSKTEYEEYGVMYFVLSKVSVKKYKTIKIKVPYS